MSNKERYNGCSLALCNEFELKLAGHRSQVACRNIGR